MDSNVDCRGIRFQFSFHIDCKGKGCDLPFYLNSILDLCIGFDSTTLSFVSTYDASNVNFAVYEIKTSPLSSTGVGGIMVSIAAFQAVDPGSIPGRRSLLFCKISKIHLILAYINAER